MTRSSSFRGLLASLEAEYCKLEAENSTLQISLAAGTAGHPQRWSSQAPLCQQAACDIEAVLPAQVFQLDCVHHMTPVTPIGENEVSLTPATAAESLLQGPSESPRQTKARFSHVSEMWTPAMPTEEVNVKFGRASEASNHSWASDAVTDFGSESHARKSLKSSKSATSLASASSKRRTLKQTRSHLRTRSLFSNDELIKARVRENCMGVHYDVSDNYKSEGCAQAIARASVFDNVTLAVIALNSVWIAIETDHNQAELLVDADVGFVLAENLFCSYFFVEILIRYAAFERKKNCLRDIWFVFDVGLVAMMVFETWVFLLLGAFTQVSLGNVSVLRIVRLFRLTRMARLARLLREVPELMILIKGVAAAARSVFFTLVLLCVLLYVFGIAFTQLMKSTDAGALFFPNVVESMNTLWLYAALLNEVSYLAREIRKDNPVALVVLDMFILAASLTVMNMLIGVLCEVVNNIAVREKETASLNFVKEKIEQVFHSLGIEPETSCITKELFGSVIENSDGVKAISELGVDVVQLLDMADFLFQSDEIDGDFEALEVELSFDQFMDKVTELRGTNYATVKDIMQLRKFIRDQSAKALHHQEEYLDDRILVSESFCSSARTMVHNNDETSLPEAVDEIA